MCPFPKMPPCLEVKHSCFMVMTSLRVSLWLLKVGPLGSSMGDPIQSLLLDAANSSRPVPDSCVQLYAEPHHRVSEQQLNCAVSQTTLLFSHLPTSQRGRSPILPSDSFNFQVQSNFRKNVHVSRPPDIQDSDCWPSGRLLNWYRG